MFRPLFGLKKIWLGIVGLLLVTTALIIFAAREIPGPAHEPVAVTFEQPMGGDFTVPSTQGRFDTRDERGRVLFLFFGFTHCPHICPTTLANFSAMFKGLPPALAEQARVVFISVDPERDTLAALKKHIANFRHKNILGATDTDENMKILTGLFGATFSRYKTASGSPVVEHTSDIFVINQRGEWVERLPFNTNPEELRRTFEVASDLRPVQERLHPLKNLDLLAGNETCDIGTDPCDVAVDGLRLRMIALPKNPRQGQKIEITVDSPLPDWTPLLLDLKGIERDMGFLRPILQPKGNNVFTTSFEVPLCEVKSMHWNVRLVLRNTAGEMAAVTFLLKTESQEP